MRPIGASWVVVLLFVYAQANSPYYEALAAHADVRKYEPMVAFHCGKPAMHRTESGWEADDTTDCLTEPVHILDYCRKKYASQDIRNIVESSAMYTITHWCVKGHKHCKHSGQGQEHTVRPFRCLAGEFQSDALLVPPHCNFSHEHNAKRCMDFYDWSGTATEKCQQRAMHLQSFAMLQPCGLKVFTGVEYVCCPGVNTVQKGVSVVAKKTAAMAKEAKHDDEVKVEGKVKVKVEEVEDQYQAYLHYGADGVHSEHERFRGAVRVWQKKHHERITKMMKDWALARKHVQDLRPTNLKAAEMLNKEMTERFQKMYQALEQDGGARKRQLNAIHQQRIQAQLNIKKRTAMEEYLKALEDEEPTAIMKALERYIRSEEKDRIHTINHFEHIRETDPDDSERILPQTKEHLRVIDQRVNQSLAMLHRVPHYRAKIALQIKEFMKNYKSVDESIRHVISQATKLETDPEKMLDNMETKKPINKPIKQDDTTIEQDLYEKPKEKPELKPQEKLQEKLVHVALTKTKPRLELIPLKGEEKKPLEEKKEANKEQKEEQKEEEEEDIMIEDGMDGKIDTESTENEHSYMKLDKVGHAAHVQQDTMSVNRAAVGGAAVISTASAGSTFGIAMGSVAVFVIIIVAIVLLRKKAAGSGGGHRGVSSRSTGAGGFVEVEHVSTCSPEERHVANMQMNGYENPTYKYFETGPQAAAPAGVVPANNC